MTTKKYSDLTINQISEAMEPTAETEVKWESVKKGWKKGQHPAHSGFRLEVQGLIIRGTSHECKEEFDLMIAARGSRDRLASVL